MRLKGVYSSLFHPELRCQGIASVFLFVGVSMTGPTIVWKIIYWNEMTDRGI